MPPAAVEELYGHKEMEGNTVQVSAIDRAGNAVAPTQTLGRFFGNTAVTRELGFVYNNVLEVYSPRYPMALRPRAIVPTDMTPTIVVKEGELLLVLGSALSSRIPGIVSNVFTSVIDRGMPLADAVAAPRVTWSWGSTSGVLTRRVAARDHDHAPGAAPPGLSGRPHGRTPQNLPWGWPSRTWSTPSTATHRPLTCKGSATPAVTAPPAPPSDRSPPPHAPPRRDDDTAAESKSHT